MNRYRTGKDPQRGPGGPRRVREDDAGRGAAAPAGAITRWAGSRTAPPSATTTPRSTSAGMSLSLALAPFEWKGHKINLIDTPGLRRLHRRRRAPRCGSPTWPCSSSARSRASRSQTEAVWRLAAELGVPRMVFINKLDRERASTSSATLDQLRDRFGAGVAPLELPIGEEAGVPRRRRPAHRHRLLLRRRHGAPRATIPDDMEELEHQVHDNLVEGIVVGRRRAARALPRGRRAVASRSSSTPSPTASTHGSGVPGGVRLGHRPSIGVDRLADFICEIGPSPLDRPAVEVAAGDTDRRGGLRPRRRPAGLRLQDHRRPVRRPRLAVQGAVGHDPARRPPRQHAAPAPTSACTACSRCGARSTSTVDRGAPPATSAPSAKLTDTAHRRHPRPQGQAGDGRRRRHRPSRCCRSRSSPRTQADEDKLGHGPAPAAGGGPGARRRPRRRDPPDPAAGRGRDPPRRSPSSGSSGSSAWTSTPRTVEVALPGDDHRRPPRPRAATRSRPAATASSAWPRPRRAARAGRGLRVRRQGRRRGHPARVHPRRAEGRRGGHGRRRRPRLPGRRRAGRAARRQGPHGRLVRDGFKMAGRLAFREALAEAAPVVLEPVSLLEVDGAHRPPGRRHGRPQQPGGAGCGHRAGDAGPPGGHRPGARPPSCPLRRRPALAHRRPGPVHRPARPLRRRPRPPGRPSSSAPPPEPTRTGGSCRPMSPSCCPRWRGSGRSRLAQLSGLGSVKCSRTSPSTPSTSTRPRASGGSSSE